MQNNTSSHQNNEGKRYILQCTLYTYLFKIWLELGVPVLCVYVPDTPSTYTWYVWSIWRYANNEWSGLLQPTTQYCYCHSWCQSEFQTAAFLPYKHVQLTFIRKLDWQANTWVFLWVKIVREYRTNGTYEYGNWTIIWC